MTEFPSHDEELEFEDDDEDGNDIAVAMSLRVLFNL